MTDLAWLDDPKHHSFVPSTSDLGRCFSCGQPAEEHPAELDYLERRRQEARDRERFGRPEGAP